MAEKEKYIGGAKMFDKPKKPLKFMIAERTIKTKHLDDDAVTTPKIQDKAVTPEKLSDSVKTTVIDPPIHALDLKYKSITDNLYQLVTSIHEGGVALAGGMGDSTTIGISQKGITNVIMRLWDKISEITGEDYTVGYTMEVRPTFIIADELVGVHVHVHSKDSICGFENIKFYANGVLKDAANLVDDYESTFFINETSVIRCEALMAGKTIVKEETVTLFYPFFIGSGNVYTDIINEECWRTIDGTLEGDYDVRVKHNGEHIIIIIPMSRQEEFRRATLDMNGIEIPFNVETVRNMIVLTSENTYNTGTYNIDININS